MEGSTVDKIITGKLDGLILANIDHLLDIYLTIYKARGGSSYKYWGAELNHMIKANEKIAFDMVQKNYNIYINQINKTIRKSFFSFKARIDITYEAVNTNLEEGLFNIHFSSAKAGAQEFAEKVGVATSFSAADSYAIDYYKFLTEQSARYLLDTDKKVLSGILNTANVEGLSVRETKKLLISNLSDVDKITSRAHNIATTETTKSLNWAKFRSGMDAQIKMKKTWFTAGDKRVRLSHIVMDGVTQKLEEPFITGLGNPCQYPGDADLPSADIVGCRCSFSEYPA